MMDAREIFGRRAHNIDIRMQCLSFDVKRRLRLLFIIVSRRSIFVDLVHKTYICTHSDSAPQPSQTALMYTVSTLDSLMPSHRIR